MVDGGIEGSATALLIGDQSGGRLCMVRCRWRGTSPSSASGFQRGSDIPFVDGCWESDVSRECSTGDTVGWPDDGSMSEEGHGRGDGTGARSGPPSQAVWYYHTQLAIIANGRSSFSMRYQFGFLRVIQFWSDRFNQPPSPRSEPSRNGGQKESRRCGCKGGLGDDV